MIRERLERDIYKIEDDTAPTKVPTFANELKTAVSELEDLKHRNATLEEELSVIRKELRDLRSLRTITE